MDGIADNEDFMDSIADNEGSWYSVTYQESSESIEEITLDCNNLQGSIPSSISNLSNCLGFFVC